MARSVLSTLSGVGAVPGSAAAIAPSAIQSICAYSTANWSAGRRLRVHAALQEIDQCRPRLRGDVLVGEVAGLEDRRLHPRVVGGAEVEVVDADVVAEGRHRVALRVLTVEVAGEDVEDGEAVLHLHATMHQHRLLHLDGVGAAEPGRLRADEDRRLGLLDQRLDALQHRVAVDVVVVGADRDDVAGAATVLEEEPHRAVKRMRAARLHEVPGLLAGLAHHGEAGVGQRILLRRAFGAELGRLVGGRRLALD